MSFQLVDLRSFAGKGGIRKGTFAPAMDLQLGYLGTRVMLRYGAARLTPAGRRAGFRSSAKHREVGRVDSAIQEVENHG